MDYVYQVWCWLLGTSTNTHTDHRQTNSHRCHLSPYPCTRYHWHCYLYYKWWWVVWLVHSIEASCCVKLDVRWKCPQLIS